MEASNYIPGLGTHFKIQSHDLADDVLSKVSGSGSGASNTVNVRSYGAYTVEERPGFDSYAALTRAIDDASTKGLRLEFDKGTYEVSQGLVGRGSSHRIAGASATLTFIKCLDVNADVLTLGPGAAGSGLSPSGYITGLALIGPQQRPDTNSVGLLLDGLRFFHVEDVRAGYVTFSFDLRNNCYGSYFTNCRSIFGESQVGVLLRGADGSVWGSGSDLTFHNCWFSGNKAAVWIHRDGGGYHFDGGQFGMGFSLSADNDAIGCVVFGMDYFDNSKVGGVGNMDFNGIDIEGWHYGWAFRGYGRTNMTISNCSFLATSTTAKAMGVFKVTNAENGQYTFMNNNVNGQYTQAKLLSIAGHGSALGITEISTTFGYGCYANSVQVQTGTTLLAQSDFGVGISFGRQGGNPYVSFGKTRLRTNNGVLEISLDHGATYVPATGAATATTGRSTTNLYPGKPEFDTTLNKPIWRNAANTGWVDSAGQSV